MKMYTVDYCLFIHSSITYALFIDILHRNYYCKQCNAQNEKKTLYPIEMIIYKILLTTS